MIGAIFDKIDFKTFKIMETTQNKFNWNANTHGKEVQKILLVSSRCSIGDFGTILFFQITQIPWPVLAIMTLAIINGLITSIILKQLFL